MRTRWSRAFVVLAMSRARALSTAPRILLGSGSATRRAILDEMGVAFDVLTADIDEGRRRPRRARARVRVRRHRARARARARDRPRQGGRARRARRRGARARRRCGDGGDAGGGGGGGDGDGAAAPARLLLTCDQVVLDADANVLEKPRDEAEARAMLAKHSGGACAHVGSAVLVDLLASPPRRFDGVDVCTVTFEPFAPGVVDALVAEGGVRACAGGLMIEPHRSSRRTSRASTARSTPMGLCKARVRRLAWSRRRLRERRIAFSRLHALEQFMICGSKFEPGL